MRDGEPVKMSKRAGEFVTLRDVVDEVGLDAVRFMMLFRKNDATLGLRPRQGHRAVEGQSGLLRAVCPCALPLGAAAGRRGLSRGSIFRRPALASAELSVLSDPAELEVSEAAVPVSARRRSSRRGARAAPRRVLPLRARQRLPWFLEQGQRSASFTLCYRSDRCRLARGWVWSVPSCPFSRRGLGSWGFQLPMKCAERWGGMAGSIRSIAEFPDRMNSDKLSRTAQTPGLRP